MTHPNLEVKRLRLLGKRKIYDLPPFKPGLNVIYGSTDTGKSMILRIISYCLGKLSIVKMAPEVKNSCTHALLEVKISGEDITIKRDLISPTAVIEIFYSPLDRISTKPDKLCHITGKKGLVSLSSFLLNKLKIPTLKVPYAPKNGEKSYNTISVKDIINLIYLNDDDIGSNSFLGMDHPSKHIKYIESLKSLLNLDSSIVQDLYITREDLRKQKNELSVNSEEVAKFLTRNSLIISKELSSDKIQSLEKEIVDLEDQKSKMENAIRLANEKIQSNPIAHYLREDITSKKEEVSEIQEELSFTQIKILEFRELLKEYSEKLERKSTLFDIYKKIDLANKEDPLYEFLIQE